MGHLGILPQSVKGKFKVKGKNLREQNQLLKDAKAIEQAVRNVIKKKVNNIKTVTNSVFLNGAEYDQVYLPSCFDINKIYNNG